MPIPKKVENVNIRWKSPASDRTLLKYDYLSLYTLVVKESISARLTLLLDDMISVQTAMAEYAVKQEPKVKYNEAEVLTEVTNELRILAKLGKSTFTLKGLATKEMRTHYTRLRDRLRRECAYAIELGQLYRKSTEVQMKGIDARAADAEARLDDVFTELADKLTSLKLSVEWTDFYLKKVQATEELIYGHPKTEVASMKQPKVKRFGLERQYWIALLGLVTIYFIAALFSSSTNVTVGNKTFALPSFDYWHFLVPLALLSLGFAKISKELKVQQNLLEQYRHRYISAASLQLILASDSNSLFEPEDRRVVVQQAAEALFQMKNTGYLSKNDNSSPLVEVMSRTIGK